MKTGVFTSALLGCLLISTAVGHPLDFLDKRFVKTETVFKTTTVAKAVVYVDESGNPYMTSTLVTDGGNTSPKTTGIPQLPGTTAPVSSAESTQVEALPTNVASSPPTAMPSSVNALPVPPTTSVQVPDPTPSVFEAPGLPELPANPTANARDRFPLGITYDPFKGEPGQCQCKTASEMAAEFEKMKEFGIMRIYGNDCGVIPIAVQQAKKNGQTIMAGIYVPNQDIKMVVSTIADSVRRYNDENWDIISVVSVENERVNAHVMTASDAAESVNQARAVLKEAGYSGPVGVVETAPAVIDNPSLCEHSDVTLVNIHAFFDPNTKAEDAGEFVKSEVARVKKACPDKRVVVTESGWPHRGISHDKAIVSKDAQRAAMNSIRAAFDHDLFLFNAFDSPWKTDDDTTWNAERYWGIL